MTRRKLPFNPAVPPPLPHMRNRGRCTNGHATPRTSATPLNNNQAGAISNGFTTDKVFPRLMKLSSWKKKISVIDLGL